MIWRTVHGVGFGPSRGILVVTAALPSYDGESLDRLIPAMVGFRRRSRPRSSPASI